jgi:VWFA-related protein
MELLETVRMGDTTIIPIYLDTETRSDTWMRKAYRTARRTLSMIAEESGGQVYEAKRIEDLNGVYEKVIKDLGKVYSLGYQSSNEVRDGGWRKITVTLPNHPNISVRTRPGYYAK